MELVVHQDHRPAEGVYHPHLIGQRRVAGESLDPLCSPVGSKHLVGVDGLGDGVGNGCPPQQLAKGHAHIRPQHSRLGGRHGHAVEGGDLLHQPVQHQLGGDREDQTARIQGHQPQLEPPAGHMDGGEHCLVTAEGRLDGGFHILQEYHRRAHVRQQQRGIAGAYRVQALLAQQVVRRWAGRSVQRREQHPQAVLLHGLGEQLRQQQLHGFRILSVQACDAQQLPRGGVAHLIDPGRVAQQAQQLRDPPLTEADGGEQRFAATQRHDAVAPPADALRGGVRHPQCLQLGQQRFARICLLKAQRAGGQQRLILRLPQIKALLINILLHHRIDQMGDIPVHVNIFPDAGGADILQLGG